MCSTASTADTTAEREQDGVGEVVPHAALPPDADGTEHGVQERLSAGEGGVNAPTSPNTCKRAEEAEGRGEHAGAQEGEHLAYFVTKIAYQMIA
jgi:hypothetical protein